MAFHLFGARELRLPLLVISFAYVRYALAFTGTTYRLDAEYSGNNFFDGWDFYTGGDPTGGFVTYYSRASAQLTGLIVAQDGAPTYIGSDYSNFMPSTNAAGRPSVRISTKKSWTHGLFIGDIAHMPAGVCGSWPAFWTLGPTWPYTGEVDIMEGVNLNNHNGMTLHTNPVCTIAGDDRLMSGQLQTSDCAYYPGYNVGCSISDNRTSSFGANFNNNGGGVYAMQWTSEYIRVWFFPRGEIPTDIASGDPNPNPGSWGLPKAHFQGDCVIDEHFQSHKIIINNAFCGEYAGAPGVWDSSENSCAAFTGYLSCSQYVAENPTPFQLSYWHINWVRVYQLVDPNANPTDTPTPYIASLQPTQSTEIPPQAPVATPSTSFCPTYNLSVVQDGPFQYEIACGVNPAGADIGEPYSGYPVHSFEDCVAGCTYWNYNITDNICGAVAFNTANNACYWKRTVGDTPMEAGFNGARLIYYAYPRATGTLTTESSISTETFVSTVVTPQTWREASTTISTSFSLESETPLNSFTNNVGHGTTSPFYTESTTTTLTTTTSSITSPLTTTTALSSSSSTETSELPTSNSVFSSLASSPSSSPSSTTTHFVPVMSTTTSTTTTVTLVSSTTDSPRTESSAMTSHSTSIHPSSFSDTHSESTILSLFPLSTTTTTIPTTSSSASSSLSLQQSTTGPQSSSSTSEHASSVVTTHSTTGPHPTASITSALSILPTSTIRLSVTSSYMVESSSSTTTSHPSAQSTTGAIQHTVTITTSDVISPLTTDLSSLVQFTSTVHTSTPASSSLSSSSSSTDDSPPSTISLVNSVSESLTALTPATSDHSSHSSTTTPFIEIGSSSTEALTTVTTSSLTFSFIPTTSTTTTAGGPTTTAGLSIPPVVADYTYAGCLGPRPDSAFANSFTIIDSSPLMSIDRCVGECDLRASKYAAIYDALCLCSFYNQTVPDTDYVRYPDSACNTPCPGNPTQRCGGLAIVPLASPSISLVLRMEKRQVIGGNGEEQVLVILYNSTINDIGPGTSSSTAIATGTSTGTTSGPAIEGPGMGSKSASLTSVSSLTTPSAPVFGTSTTNLSPTSSPFLRTSASQVINPTLPNTAVNSSSGSYHSSLTSSLLYGTTANSMSTTSSSSITFRPTVISTTWITICAIHPSTCPTPTPTSLVTTITLLHCGCTDLPAPNVPMTTSVVPCGHGCQGVGEGDAHHDGDWEGWTSDHEGGAGWNGWHPDSEHEANPLTTLTVPCTSEIRALQESVNAWYASATAAPGANADAHTDSGAENGEGEREAQSYSFSATGIDVVTATLTLAHARPDSGGQHAPLAANATGGNATWTSAGVTPYTSALESSSGAGAPGSAGATQFHSSAASRRSMLKSSFFGGLFVFVCIGSVVVICGGALCHSG